ncbi:non-ribosomal peptide synthetase, partial [Mesorhizobium sp. M00.F.Ca.ET.186.01.1.1]
MSRKKVDNIYPLTPMQEGMLFHSLLDEGSESYFEQMRFTIKGLIDPAILEQSLNALIERHDILRTVFLLEKVQKPRQIVLRERKTKVQVLDITHLSEEEQAACLEDFAQKDRQTSFDLAKDVLIRLTLVRTSADTHTLFWSHHHILLDGWCIPIVLNDFFQIYQQRKGGLPVELGPVYPYSTYISWLGKQDAEEAKASWAEYISGYEPTSFIHKQGGKNNYRQAELVFAIEQALTDSLNKLAKQLQVTVNNLFRAIWGLMLQRQCNTEDVVFGSVVSGRPSHLPNVEQMVGLFINTVPIRVQAGAEQTFSELVKQVQQEALSLAKYHYLSLADIQGNQQLIDHILLFQNYPMGQQFLTRLNQYNEEFTLTHLSAFEQTNYDLNVMVTPSDVITIKYVYNAAVFSEEQLLHISRQLTTIMTQVTNAPDILLQKLEVVDPAEKQLQLHSFNDTYRHYPTDKLIHQMFEERAEREPERIALVMGEQVLTYRELNEKANQLAKLLRARGIGPESMVSLLTERSAEMMIAILAIFKAGGAYLPIDPAHPEERRAQLLRDGQVRFVLTQSWLAERLGWPADIQCLAVDRVEGSASSLLSFPERPEDLAYVIYTSGSTGAPKGVMIDHRGAVNTILDINERFAVSTTDKVLALSNLNFDLSAYDVFGLLAAGGTIVMPDAAKAKDPAHWIEWLEQEQVTVWNTVPALMQMLIEYAAGQKASVAPSLRLVLLSGDWIPLDLPDKIKAYFPHAQVIGLGGATEASIWSNFYPIEQIEPEWKSIPYGRPMLNQRFHVLNEWMGDCPVWVPGQ